MPRLACTRCAVIRIESRCAECKHLTHDLDTKAGRDALTNAIRRRTTGALFLLAGSVLGGCTVSGIAQSLYEGSFDSKLAPLELGLFVSTPLLVAGFALGFRSGPLRKLRSQTVPKRRAGQRGGPTRF